MNAVHGCCWIAVLLCTTVCRAQGHILDSPEMNPLDVREGRRLELSPNWDQLSYRPRAPVAVISGLQKHHAREVRAQYANIGLHVFAKSCSVSAVMYGAGSGCACVYVYTLQVPNAPEDLYPHAEYDVNLNAVSALALNMYNH